MPHQRTQRGTVGPCVDVDLIARVRVYNPGPLAIAENDVVRVATTSPNRGIYQHVQPALSSAVPTVYYIALNTIPVGSYGMVSCWKMVVGVDTSTSAIGDPVYLSDTLPGTFTQASLPPPVDIVVGVVTRVGASDGSVILKAPQDVATQALARGRRTVFFPGDLNANSGDYRVRSVSTNGGMNFTFAVPEDFVQLASLVLVGQPSAGAAGAGKDIDLTSDYGLAGQSASFNSEADLTSVYDLSGTAGQNAEVVDLSAVFSALEAGQYCGVRVKHNGIGGSISYLGIRMVYLVA